MANVEALEQLRRVVLSAPDDGFDMSWFGKRTECGTVCCAAGWAALDPWFRENTRIGEILRIDTRPDSEKDEFRRDELFDINIMFTGEDTPIDQLSYLFDISYENANALFNGPTAEGVSKVDVIANIDHLIAGEPAEVYALEEESADYDW